MESNRAVTRFAVGLYVLLGLIALAVFVLTGVLGPILFWVLIPVGCLLFVLAQFAIVGPLMLLTAWIAGGRGDRESAGGRGEERGVRTRGKW